MKEIQFQKILKNWKKVYFFLLPLPVLRKKREIHHPGKGRTTGSLESYFQLAIQPHVHNLAGGVQSNYALECKMKLETAVYDCVCVFFYNFTYFFMLEFLSVKLYLNFKTF